MVQNESDDRLESQLLKIWDEEAVYFKSTQPHVRPLFLSLRERGYDRQLFLYTSRVRFGDWIQVHSFCVARSLNRIVEYPILTFTVNLKNYHGYKVVFRAGQTNIMLDVEGLQISPEVENLLACVLAWPFDYLSFLDSGIF